MLARHMSHGHMDDGGRIAMGALEMEGRVWRWGCEPSQTSDAEGTGGRDGGPRDGAPQGRVGLRNWREGDGRL